MMSFNFKDLHKVPLTSGLYAWYVNIADKKQANLLHQIHRDKKLQAIIKGIFNETYEGKLVSQGFNFQENDLDNDLFIETFNAFNIPLYIGMSGNLNERLNRHAELISKYYIENITYDNKSRILNSDTEEESDTFAKRLAYYIKGKVKLSQLVIKVVELKTSKKQLHLIENYLNRSFLPVLGRN